MNFFQMVVIGLLISVVGIGGYYISAADEAGILGQAVEGNKILPSDAQLAQATGAYTCRPSTGCKNEYTLILREGGEGELSTFVEEGAEMVTERGNWSIGKRGYVTLELLGNQSGTYDLPKTFLIRSIGTSTLSRIVYSTEQYKNMIRPVFVKNLEE